MSELQLRGFVMIGVDENSSFTGRIVHAVDEAFGNITNNTAIGHGLA